MSNSVRPHRWQPTRLPHPWDSPGKNTGVGCHFLLQCVKVKSESEVAQSCPTLSDPMDYSLPGSSIQGISQARVLEWAAIAFPWLRLFALRGLFHFLPTLHLLTVNIWQQPACSPPCFTCASLHLHSGQAPTKYNKLFFNRVLHQTSRDYVSDLFVRVEIIHREWYKE